MNDRRIEGPGYDEKDRAEFKRHQPDARPQRFSGVPERDTQATLATTIGTLPAESGGESNERRNKAMEDNWIVHSGSPVPLALKFRKMRQES
jgi:hypothetical protein